MIYYFSGTGNSAFVAAKLAEYTKDEYRFIPDVFTAMESDIEVMEGDVIGIVCPIYAWGVPECVVDFLTHVKVDKKAFAYIVATCGSEAGKALRQVQRVFPFNSAYSVRMPENCIALFKTDSEELVREKINVARQLLPRIAQGILSRSDTYDVKEGFEASLKSTVVNPLFSLFFMRTSRFRVANDCSGCGTCASLCPFSIIEITDGRPHWKSDRCQMCMKCVMHCPTRALRLGASHRHKVYLFPDEIMRQSGVSGSIVHEKGSTPFTEGTSDTLDTLEKTAKGLEDVSLSTETEYKDAVDKTKVLTSSEQEQEIKKALEDIAQVKRSVFILEARLKALYASCTTSDTSGQASFK